MHKFFVLLFTLPVCLFSETTYITGRLYSQLGNNLFQAATACALAWDNNAIPYFPDLYHLHYQTWCYTHVLFRLNPEPPSSEVSCIWKEPSYAYHPIPFQPNMCLEGYYQSEKYFAHHRERLLKLFAPHPKDKQYMFRKYYWLMNHPHTVGVQLRFYHEDPEGIGFIQYGRDYIEKAMALFPSESLFVVSSNNLSFAKQIIPKKANVFYLEDEPDYIDLYLLSYCKHNIISNSSFGWWSAWMNQNPNKIVVAPKAWFNPYSGCPTQDVAPESWIRIDAKWGANANPSSYY